MKNSYWMFYALTKAWYGETLGFLPIGAILVYKNYIISDGYNQKNNFFHAEFITIKYGFIKFNNLKLLNTFLYITCEPCLMCWGAIINAKIKNIFFLSYKNKYNFIKNNIILWLCIKQIKNFFIKLRYNKYTSYRI